MKPSRYGSWSCPMLWFFPIFITGIDPSSPSQGGTGSYPNRDSLSGWCHIFSLIFKPPCSSPGSLWRQWSGSLLSCFILLNAYHCESSTLVTCTCYWSTLLIQPILWIPKENLCIWDMLKGVQNTMNHRINYMTVESELTGFFLHESEITSSDNASQTQHFATSLMPATTTYQPFGFNISYSSDEHVQNSSSEGSHYTSHQDHHIKIMAGLINQPAPTNPPQK